MNEEKNMKRKKLRTKAKNAIALSLAFALAISTVTPAFTVEAHQTEVQDIENQEVEVQEGKVQESEVQKVETQEIEVTEDKDYVVYINIEGETTNTANETVVESHKNGENTISQNAVSENAVSENNIILEENGTEDVEEENLGVCHKVDVTDAADEDVEDVVATVDEQ